MAATIAADAEFELLATDGHARRGRVTLNHSVVETPIFMPVDTYGMVNGVLPRDLKAIAAQIIVGNTSDSSKNHLNDNRGAARTSAA